LQIRQNPQWWDRITFFDKGKVVPNPFKWGSEAAMKLNDRTFKLWDYRVSHNQLLLRSPKTEAMPTNIDIAFVGVEYLDLPTQLTNLVLVPAESADLDRANEVLGKVGLESEVFVIQAANRRHIVVAVAMKILENDLDIFESSLEKFWRRWNRQNDGTQTLHRRIDELGKVAGGLKAIVNLAKAEWETMRQTLDETYRLIDTTLKMFKTSTSRATKRPEQAAAPMRQSPASEPIRSRPSSWSRATMPTRPQAS
jgi:hypothetical protein